MRRLVLLIGLALLVLAAGCSSPSTSPTGLLSALAGHDEVRVVQTAVAALPDPVTLQTPEEPGIVTRLHNTSLEFAVTGGRPTTSSQVVAAPSRTPNRERTIPAEQSRSPEPK